MIIFVLFVVIGSSLDRTKDGRPSETGREDISNPGSLRSGLSLNGTRSAKPPYRAPNVFIFETVMKNKQPQVWWLCVAMPRGVICFSTDSVLNHEHTVSLA